MKRSISILDLGEERKARFCPWNCYAKARLSLRSDRSSAKISGVFFGGMGRPIAISFAHDMKVHIAGKLSRELEDEIVSERQVVYILVESRKLLEQQGTLASYRNLKLCADWAVHPRLHGRDAHNVLMEFDSYEVAYQTSQVSVSQYSPQPFLDFLSFSSFRNELVDALASQDVETDPLTHDPVWQSFIQLYTSVIRDCPLEAKNNNTQLVTEVTAMCWPKDMADTIYPGKRVVQWNWKLKSGVEREKLVCALI